jgi:hypothetical protein
MSIYTVSGNQTFTGAFSGAQVTLRRRTERQEATIPLVKTPVNEQNLPRERELDQPHEPSPTSGRQDEPTEPEEPTEPHEPTESRELRLPTYILSLPQRYDIATASVHRCRSRTRSVYRTDQPAVCPIAFKFRFATIVWCLWRRKLWEWHAGWLGLCSFSFLVLASNSNNEEHVREA